MYFNRYTANLDELSSALNEGDELYCDPDRYFVSHHDCWVYLEELKNGQKKNKDFCNKKITKVKSIIWIIEIIVFVVINGLLIHYFDKYIYLFAYLFVSCIIFIPLFGLYLLNRQILEDYYSNRYYSRFFPPKDVKIEKLFDDYLWKKEFWYQDIFSNEKSEEDKKNKEMVILMSHPGIDVFIKTIEKELECPSENYLIGDLYWGMSREDIFNSRLFTGVSKIKHKNNIDLGRFRTRKLFEYFIFPDGELSFNMEEDSLNSIEFKYKSYSHIFSHDDHDINKRYLLCCERLNQLYGNPINLAAPHNGERNMIPEDKAYFKIGRKTIKLCIDNDVIKLIFYEDKTEPCPQNIMNATREHIIKN